jgi:hypothetical protein
MFFLPVAVIIWYLIENKYSVLLRYLAVFLGISAMLWGIFHIWLGEHLWFYTWELPGLYRMRWGALAANTWAILSIPAVFVVVIVMALRWMNEHFNSRDRLFLLIGFFAFGSCVLSASKGGGMANSFQPVYLIASWYLLINVVEFLETASYSKNHSITWMFLGFLMLITAQLNPPSMITRFLEIRADSGNYEQLARELRNYEGTFYIPSDNYLSAKAGNFTYGSSKWEFEIAHGLKLPVIYTQDYNYVKKSLASDLVIVHQWDGWMKNHELRKALIDSGFVLKNKRSFSQGLTIQLFEKGADNQNLLHGQ